MDSVYVYIIHIQYTLWGSFAVERSPLLTARIALLLAHPGLFEIPPLFLATKKGPFRRDLEFFAFLPRIPHLAWKSSLALCSLAQPPLRKGRLLQPGPGMASYCWWGPTLGRKGAKRVSNGAGKNPMEIPRFSGGALVGTFAVCDNRT